MQTITRTTNIDFGHRVTNERYKCYNIHGHLGIVELTYEYDSIEEIGYAIDFKEIKRVHCQFLEDYIDHGFIANPQDHSIIELCQSENNKLWIMSLNGNEYCNPSAENISKEIFLTIDLLTKISYPNLRLAHVRFYETPNCWVDSYSGSTSEIEQVNFYASKEKMIREYAARKGVIEYDTRKSNK